MSDLMMSWIKEAFPLKSTVIFLSIVSGFYFFGDLIWDFYKKDVPAVVEEVEHVIRPLVANDNKIIYLVPKEVDLLIGQDITAEPYRVLRI